MKTFLLVVFFIISLLNIYSQSATEKTVDDSSTNSFFYHIKLITKPLLMPLLALIYWVYTKGSPSFNMHVIVALTFGWLGDIALMIKSKKSGGKIPLLMGLAFFLCGHITYALLFSKTAVHLSANNELYALIYIAYAAYAIIIYTYLEKTANAKSASTNKNIILIMKLAIIMYMLAITSMSYTSLLRLINLGSMSATFTFIGSLIFISSDSVLSLKVLGGNKHISGQYIMGSYIAAQVFIVIGYIF